MASTSQLAPTFYGYVASTKDALLLVEACLNGKLTHVARRPYDHEQESLTKSGNMFIYEEHSSGIKQWRDIVPWSCSRTMGDFQTYRKLERPFLPSGPSIEYSVFSTVPTLDQPGPNLPRSLVDSYIFKEDGLVKKTISVTVKGILHHLVSYYTVADVRNKQLITPSEHPSFQHTTLRPDLITGQDFHTPIDTIYLDAHNDETMLLAATDPLPFPSLGPYNLWLNEADASDVFCFLCAVTSVLQPDQKRSSAIECNSNAGLNDVALRLSTNVKDPSCGHVFGRHRLSDCIISVGEGAQRVSREHFQIDVEGNGIGLENLSINGTIVDGILLGTSPSDNRAIIKHGSIISVTLQEHCLTFMVLIPQRPYRVEGYYQKNLMEYFRFLGMAEVLKGGATQEDDSSMVVLDRSQGGVPDTEDNEDRVNDTTSNPLPLAPSTSTPILDIAQSGLIRGGNIKDTNIKVTQVVSHSSYENQGGFVSRTKINIPGTNTNVETSQFVAGKGAIRQTDIKGLDSE